MDLTFSQSINRRANELFEQHQQEIFRSTDRLFARLMLCQWIASIVTAWWISPFTWSGVSSQIHIHVWTAIFLGGAISLLPIWATRAWPGTAFTRHTVAIGQSLMSALLIHLTGGRLETHFHVFGSLVILSFYRDWRVLIPATVIVALDHFARGFYWPFSVYGTLTPNAWRSLEHAGWVIFEDVFLVISCLRSVREMRAIAKRTAEVEASEQQFRTIFAEAPLGIAVTDLEHRFLQTNRKLGEMLGYSDGEVRSLTPADIIHPENVRSCDGWERRLLDGELASFGSEERCVRKDGASLWISRTTSTIRDEAGRPQYYLTMVQDITETKTAGEAVRQAMQDAERANLAKSDFLSRMSHELRTPLNAILGFGQILQMRPLPKDQQESVEHILKGGRHLLSLINEVLDISRIEAGQLDFSIESIPVEVLIEETVALVKPLAQQRGIRLNLPVANVPARCCYALADMQRTKQVLLNLLSNAIKYNRDRGEVTITCEHVKDTSESGFGERIRIKVQDTGAGIAADDLRRLFTPFERLDAARRNIEGSGIGLALSKRLVEAMKGTVAVESIVGMGSAFSIELPAGAPLMENRPMLDAVTADESIQETLGTGRARRTVLQIEDNLANRQVIASILEERPDVHLVSAMQGQIGLDLARDHLPDLVLLDLHLPDMPGAEVLSRLRAEPSTRGIPVVVLSADATDHQIQRLMNMGAREYLTKPLDLPKLLRTLDEVLEETQPGPISARLSCEAVAGC